MTIVVVDHCLLWLLVVRCSDVEYAISSENISRLLYNIWGVLSNQLFTSSGSLCIHILYLDLLLCITLYPILLQFDRVQEWLFIFLFYACLNIYNLVFSNYFS